MLIDSAYAETFILIINANQTSFFMYEWLRKTFPAGNEDAKRKRRKLNCLLIQKRDVADIMITSRIKLNLVCLKCVIIFQTIFRLKLNFFWKTKNEKVTRRGEK